MPRKCSTLKTLGLLTVIVLSVIAYLASMCMIRVVEASASYTGAAKPMEFYLHYLNTPVYIAGTDNKYIMNTTKFFQAYNNSVFKGEGQPKLTLDYYLYPGLAGPVTVNGTWQVFIWANGSALKPATWDIRFYERALGGEIVWDSNTLNPTVTGGPTGNNGYLDVVPYAYNLSTSTRLDHTFSPGNTIEVEVSINPSGAAACRVWYDSASFPSKLILPAQDYAKPAWVKTYAVDNSETNLFYYNWSAAQRKVIVRVNVTDPFGGYDIYRVNMTILDPTGIRVLDNVDMARVSDGQWRLNYVHLFEANWTYPSTAQLGDYTVKVSVIDNNGYHRSLSTGSFAPFIEYNDHVFSIGEIVYYNPAFRIVDDVDAPLPNAQVFITWPNGSRDTLPRYTVANGFINLTQVLPANYGFTILWKDVVVKQATIYVDSDGPYTIKTEVYQLTVNVLGNNRAAVHGAYVIIYTQTGVGYGLDTTDATGQAVFKLPKGTYNIEAHFSAEYWLKVLTTSATEPAVSVDASTSKTIVLEEFPPPIWTTPGFWLLMALAAVSVFAAIYIVFLSRRHVPLRRKR